jgi:hypothetical protein
MIAVALGEGISSAKSCTTSARASSRSCAGLSSEGLKRGRPGGRPKLGRKRPRWAATSIHNTRCCTAQFMLRCTIIQGSGRRRLAPARQSRRSAAGRWGVQSGLHEAKALPQKDPALGRASMIFSSTRIPQMDWLSADLLVIFARKFRILRSKKRLVLLSPAASAVIGL